MQQKEKKMQAFIDNFDAMRQEHQATARLVQQRIVQLLKETNPVIGVHILLGASTVLQKDTLCRQ